MILDDIEASHEVDDDAPPSYEPPMIIEQQVDSKPLKSIMKSPPQSQSTNVTPPDAAQPIRTTANGMVETNQVRTEVKSSSKHNGTKKLHDANNVEMDTYAPDKSDRPLDLDVSAEQQRPLLGGVSNGSSSASNKNVLLNADGAVLLEDIESLNSEELNTQL